MKNPLSLSFAKGWSRGFAFIRLHSRLKIVLWGVLIFSVLAAARNSFAQTADEVIQAVENNYRNLTDLTAKVTQKNFLKSLDKTQTFEGAFYLKKPGRLRLDYTNGQSIVVDGKEAWFYSKKSEEVIKRTFTDFAHANIPVAFLLGAGKIRDDFDVAQPDPKIPRLLELIPKKSGGVLKKLRIEADEAGLITKLFIFDRSGNVTELLFTDIRENAGVADRLFKFSVPKGTEIIEQ